MPKPVTVFAALLTAAVVSVGAAQSQPGNPAAGWSQSALDDATSYVASQRSTGFVVIDRGRVIVERHWPLPDSALAFRNNFVHGTAGDGSVLEDVASQQKSFIAILAGVAIDRRLLEISQPVSAYAKPGWSKATAAQESRITVRHLLEMNSGLKEDLTVEAEPDTKFFYNTPAYAILKAVLEGASGRPLDDLTRDWLTAPAGMKDTSWRKRPAVFAGSGNPT
jgi:CubicO group peptidase (beta-lactamase class C family)